MKLLGNLIWLLCGGIFIAIEYIVASFLLAITIVGIPFALQTLKLAGLALWPFGKDIQNSDGGSGCLNTIFNVLWIFIGGIWISLSHLVLAFLLGITIIGIPFSKQHIKLAHVALVPFGKRIV